MDRKLGMAPAQLVQREAELARRARTIDDAKLRAELERELQEIRRLLDQLGYRLLD